MYILQLHTATNEKCIKVLGFDTTVEGSLVHNDVLKDHTGCQTGLLTKPLTIRLRTASVTTCS